MPYETDVLLSADVSHKVLRQTTVLEFLYELYNSGRARNFYDEACKQLIGQIVLTRYRRPYSHFLSLSIVFLAFFASVVFSKISENNFTFNLRRKRSKKQNQKIQLVLNYKNFILLIGFLFFIVITKLSKTLCVGSNFYLSWLLCSLVRYLELLSIRYTMSEKLVLYVFKVMQ